MAEESVMDAMNAVLEGEIESPPEEIETPEAETSEVETPSEDGETTEETPSEDGETDEEAEARGAERDPATGKFIKKGEEKLEGEKVADKKAEPKAKDPVNDPIPTGLKKETTERIRTLIDTTKTVTAERDQIKQDFDYLIKGVEATGATPQQYGEVLSWMSLFNSNNPQQQEKALELVESVAERLATLLGKERSVGDPLSAHSDLKDAVQKGQITAQYAKEIARTRNGQQFRTQLTTGAQQEQQRQEAAAQELQTARNDLSALEQTLQASDPSYEAKKAILVPALKPVFASIPPSQWKQKFTEAYRAIRINAPAAVSKPATTNQPLRAGKQPAGGQTKAPSSALEAMGAALSGMGK